MVKRRVALFLAALALASPAHAQSIHLNLKDAPLKEALSQVRAQSGYEFAVHGRLDSDDVRATLALEYAPLPEALKRIAALYHCRIRPLDPATLRVDPTGEEVAAGLVVGPYRLRLESPEPAGDAAVILPLTVTADDVRTLAGLIGLVRLHVVDRLSRNLLADPRPGSPLSNVSMSGLGEWRAGIQLALPAGPMPRARLLQGALRAYARVLPVRLELPLAGDTPARAVDGAAQAVLDGFYGLGDTWTAEVRVSTPPDHSLAGQLVVGDLSPHLVDRRGRVYRPVGGEETREETEGRVVRSQHWRFERVVSSPVRLVFDLFDRSGELQDTPLVLRDVVLPPSGAADPLAEFLAEAGGSLSLPVQSTDGKSPGALSVALSRQTPAGWSSWRWLEVTPGDAGDCSLEGLAEGEYRVLRVGRSAGVPPAPPELSTVRIRKGRTAVLPPLRTPGAASSPPRP